MGFFQNFIQLDPINNTIKILLFILLLSLILIAFAFYFDFLKNKKNEKKISILERAIKELIEEFRTLELRIGEGLACGINHVLSNGSPASTNA